ncbi:MAG: hypothetical protein MUC49_15450 [Raineya sp.]|jgi:hypothetical protein|nr:hypothetical protein [Raineya sp.]
MDTEAPKQQQTNYGKEVFTTLISIGLIIIFFATKNIKPEGNVVRGAFGMIGFFFLQIMATGIQLSLTIFSWMSKNEKAKTIYMIISIVIIVFILFILASIK